MRKKDELKDPKSCLNKAKKKEMIFVLLGRDMAAAVAVRAWINERIRLGKNKPEDKKIKEAEGWIETVVKEQREIRDNGDSTGRSVSIVEKSGVVGD